MQKVLSWHSVQYLRKFNNGIETILDLTHTTDMQKKLINKNDKQWNI